MATRKKMDLLMAVEQIVENAKGTGLSSEFYRKADRYIKYLSERMDLTKEQSVMMALFIDNCDDTCITVNNFCEYLGCRPTKIIRYMEEIDVLEKRELVRCCREYGNFKYRVPNEVVDAFKNNKKYEPMVYSGLSCQELFGEIEEVFKLRENHLLTYEATVEKICYLLDCNSQLLFVQKVRSYKLSKEDEILLVFFSHLFVNNDYDDICYHDFEFLYGKKNYWIWVKISLNIGSHTLIKEKLVEYNNNNGLADRESFCLTANAKRELFEELNLSSLNKDKKRGDVIKTEEIVSKRLFYDEKISSQIEELGNLLDDVKYNEIRTRMKETGFRCGFTCLFYGDPGTGKTETVLQLAKQTGRDVVQVNISQIKSKWVGESEKNIKQIFDDYRSKVINSEITPILLFNEADAIIGKRREGVDRSVDKMENSIQNIILQEMETLDGILIATTNLAQNMDKAFERRFLYKIKFEKPTVDARMNMWHEMLPVLKEEETRVLASKYNFSGGQIENVARHYTIRNILHGEPGNIVDVLSSFCDNERLDNNENCRIGFK
ncbi:MAG: ATP-binding protein [Paludibacteraceae bacterium]|nr:ATP-binding protein [Paludibacteraceae bacterium]